MGRKVCRLGCRANEKQLYESQTVSFVDSADGDEALKLVGREREVHFSEEYNRKLRNKLVSVFVPDSNLDRS